MQNLNITYRDPRELKPRRREFRTHSAAQIESCCRSIREYRFNDPVAIDAEDRIVCGALRVAAARKLELTSIPVIRLDHLSEAQLRAYAIAVNKLADRGGYDEVELSLELADIQALLGTVELPELGIETPELDRLLDFGVSPLGEEVEADEDLEPSDGPVLVRTGDLWQLGRHRLLCGTALEAVSYAQLMGEGESAQFCFSDLPYNLPARTFSTTGRFDNFEQGGGEMSSAEFVRFLTTAMRHMSAWSSDGSIAMFFMSYHFLLELLRAGNIVYGDLKTIITWVKPHAGLGSWYRAQSEFIAAFKNGKAPHLNNLGKNGRTNRSTVWEYDSLGQFSSERDELLKAHPTCKPVPLLADAIRDCSERDRIVLDPFAGSGSLALAAEETGRVARLIELDPRYVEVALRRFRKKTGIEPVLIRTGETLQSLEEKESGK